MGDRLLFNFIIDPEMRRAIKAIKERDGISESEQARRAFVAWIESKGIRLKGGPKKKTSR
jgi:hypothetical protein